HTEVISTIATVLGADAAVIDGNTPQSQRQAIIDRFQTDTQPRVLIIQLAVGGTALTLHAATHVLFGEISWVPADNVQGAQRCHRIGQTSPVLARVVSLAGSIDEVVAAIVTKKASELAEFEGHITKEPA